MARSAKPLPLKFKACGVVVLNPTWSNFIKMCVTCYFDSFVIQTSTVLIFIAPRLEIYIFLSMLCSFSFELVHSGFVPTYNSATTLHEHS